MNKFDELILEYDKKIKEKNDELNKTIFKNNTAEYAIKEYTNTNDEYIALKNEETRLLRESKEGLTEQLLECYIKLQSHYDILKPYIDIISECNLKISKLKHEINVLENNKNEIICERNALIASFVGNKYDRKLNKAFELKKH